MSYLDHEAAPFGPAVWEALEAAAREAFTEAATGRRLLRVVGPAGPGVRLGAAEDRPVEPDEETGPVAGEASTAAHIHLPDARPLPLLHRPFRVGIRTIAAFETRSEPLDTRAVVEAAQAVAQAEDRLVFRGATSEEMPGLLTQAGGLGISISDWSDPAAAADDLVTAAGRLDERGRHGPFVAAIAPVLFYRLLRPYPGSPLTPLEQLRPAFERIEKAPALREGAIVLSRDRTGPRLLVGQELAIAYDGREGAFFRFSMMESVCLLPGSAGSVAVLWEPRRAEKAAEAPSERYQ